MTAPSGTAAATAAALALAVVAAACGSPDPTVREVVVDGGNAVVTVTSPGRVEARPGDTVRITHGGTATLDGASGTPEAHDGDPAHLTGATHAFVAAEPPALPPLFVPRADGAAPNAAVWGACRGGETAADLDGCPVPTVEGPPRWDGDTYWSTGAMLPGESREVPLAPDIPRGEHILTCVFHPRLTVTVAVEEEPTTPAPPPPAPNPEDVPGPSPGDTTVAAGYARDDVRVNRFAPRQTTVEVGDTVTWEVDGPDPHDIVLGVEQPPELVDTPPSEAVPEVPDGPWGGQRPVRSGFLSTDPSAPGGDRFSLTFGAEGTYRYHCRFHPAMSGTVRVRPA